MNEHNWPKRYVIAISDAFSHVLLAVDIDWNEICNVERKTRIEKKSLMLAV